jgi:hypothetical protein
LTNAQNKSRLQNCESAKFLLLVLPVVSTTSSSNRFNKKKQKMQSTLIVNSQKTSENHHPFIEDPKKWVGTPWDSSRGPRPAKSNAELIAELHSRLENHQNVSDLFSEQHRAANLSSTGKKPMFQGTTKKLSTSSSATPSNQDLVNEAQDNNPFSEAVRARLLPIEVLKYVQPTNIYTYICLSSAFWLLSHA